MNCNKCKKKNCGCEKHLTTPPPCPPSEPCEDAQPCAYYVDPQCVIYTGEDIIIEGEVVVENGTNLTDIISNIYNNVGSQGQDGQDGQDGVGIASVTDNGDGTITFNFTDSSSFTTSNLTGPPGATGLSCKNYLITVTEETVIEYNSCVCDNSLVTETLYTTEVCDIEFGVEQGGEAYPDIRSVNLGRGTGEVSIDFQAFVAPERFIVKYDNVIVIDTGYIGSLDYTIGGSLRTQFNNSLTGKIDPVIGLPYPLTPGGSGRTEIASDGYPIVSAPNPPPYNPDSSIPPQPGQETQSFIKDKTEVTNAILEVYAPQTGTGWLVEFGCPNSEESVTSGYVISATDTPTIISGDATIECIGLATGFPGSGGSGGSGCILTFGFGPSTLSRNNVWNVGGLIYLAPSATNVGSRRIASPVTGTVKKVSIMTTVNGTSASLTPSPTINFRNDTTNTNTQITTTNLYNGTTPFTRHNVYTINAAVNEGDEINIQIVIPNWITEPTQVVHLIQVYIE